jgi:hypothetical protein
MTTDLEKQFFSTFGIEPKTGIGLVKFKEPSYPTITDRILLELICIRNSLLNRQFQVWDDSLEGLRIEILNRLLMDYKSCVQSFAKIGRERGYEFKHQVRTLFKEGEDG